MRQVMMFSKRGTSAAEVQALIDAARGAGQFDRIESIPHWRATGAVNPGANWAVLTKARSAEALTIAAISVFIGGTTGGNIDVGVYSFDGVTYTRLASSGSVAAGAINSVQRVALTAPLSIVPGVTYVLAAVADNATVLLGSAPTSHANLLAFDDFHHTKSTAFPLPATIALSGVGTTINVVWLAGTA